MKAVEAVNKKQMKMDEEIEMMRQMQINLDRIYVEKRDKEANKATLRLLCPDWTMKRIQDVAIKKVEKYWLEPKLIICSSYHCRMPIGLTNV